jgi:hypothetical protein
MKHLKPILITSLIAIAAVYIYKTYIQTNSTSLPQL